MSNTEELIERNEAARRNYELAGYNAAIALRLEWDKPIRTVIRNFMIGEYELNDVIIPVNMPLGFGDYVEFYVAEYHRLVSSMVRRILLEVKNGETIDFIGLDQFLTLIGISRRYLDDVLDVYSGACKYGDWPHVIHIVDMKWQRTR